jgi:hypothetical protein
MSDETIITVIFACIDDIVQGLAIDPHPGPAGHLSLSEVLTLMVLQPVLKPGWTLKGYWRWLEFNLRALFPGLVEYSRLRRLFNQVQEYVTVVLQRLAQIDSFGLVADGTPVSVMETVRGKYAKSFRNARKVKSASKRQWYWGFLLELVIEQQGLIAFFSIGTEAEIKQLEKILEDLADRWVLGDQGNRSKILHERLWQDKQIRIKLTGGKERQWIENVIGTLKERLGLGHIRKIRKMPSFLARLKAILCAYNLVTVLHLPI